MGFIPVDETGCAAGTASAVVMNIPPAEALMVATDLVDQLKVWEPIESVPMTRM
jgi:hypothetical protein